jgi:hypothetical protein
MSGHSPNEQALLKLMFFLQAERTSDWFASHYEDKLALIKEAQGALELMRLSTECDLCEECQGCNLVRDTTAQALGDPCAYTDCHTCADRMASIHLLRGGDS